MPRALAAASNPRSRLAMLLASPLHWRRCMTHHRLHSLLVFLCAACGTSATHNKPPDGPPGGDGGTGPTATEFLQAMAGKDCTEAFMCMSSFVPATTGDTFADEWGASVTDCSNDPTDLSNDANVESEIIKGNIVFDAAEAATCLAGITYGTCTDFWTNGAMYPTACNDALYGLVADGGACVTDYDCAGTDTTDSVCTTGKCAPAPATRRERVSRFLAAARVR
jgi:hypothetical protein